MVFFFAAALMLFAAGAQAQGNYEIQVYGADTQEPKSLMVELHSNYTVDGQKICDRRRVSDQPPGARDH